VPNLFPPDEKDRIIGDVREYAASIGKPLSKDSVYQVFIACVQANLHVVLSMSPVGEAFRRRCRMFPSLINCWSVNPHLQDLHISLSVFIYIYTCSFICAGHDMHA